MWRFDFFFFFFVQNEANAYMHFSLVTVSPSDSFHRFIAQKPRCYRVNRIYQKQSYAYRKLCISSNT